MSIKAYAAMAAKETLQRFEYDPGPLGPHEIEVAVEYCGICHSDVHVIDNDWMNGVYPLVPGHEVVGKVTRIGEHVSYVKVGQRVGIGWQCNSCGTCEWCGIGEEPLCSQNQATCVGHHGGFAQSVRANERFAFPLPEGMKSENAAPLLCGGITVYSPLRLYSVQPHHRVGVVGIGGLGHMAVQFANAMGCEVTAFSTSAGKADEARRLGAHEFVVNTDPDALKAQTGKLDFILVTAFAPLDWSAYVAMLRPHGKLCFVGAVLQPVSVSAFDLLLGYKSICGSAIGGRTLITEMLDFAARNDVQAMTEVMPMDRCNEALAKVRNNTARYRMVLKN
ncbi:alcohol dehydrogenase [candidate division GN15 bacterium]|uniref:alcohol dehydrogenase (NADP(+)) n=1 Tax=candidate division GN15 bacterium TaxID=2072418 RepID=A0A855WZM3_9BACT|nr:MAG: alcohol dehydrogenase [candidate division GN15 bacterium]